MILCSLQRKIYSTVIVQRFNIKNKNECYYLDIDVESVAEQALSSLLPKKSKQRYAKAYDTLKKWCGANKLGEINEEVLLAYFSSEMKVFKASTLWTNYSILRVTIHMNDNVDISTFNNLKAFLKRKNDDYQQNYFSTLPHAFLLYRTHLNEHCKIGIYNIKIDIVNNVVQPPFTLFMGAEKHENEELIKWGWPEDVWFHVDKVSSAHVYLRLQPGQTIEDVPYSVIEDAAQLVKANSITGNKMNNVDVVYTMWENLKKTPSMDVGQVSFHREKDVKKIRIEKRINDVVNRLNKTKIETHPDFRYASLMAKEKMTTNQDDGNDSIPMQLLFCNEFNKK